MWWLFPFVLLHEAYLILNDYIYPDQHVDDFDNKFTIVLSVLLVLWSVFVSSSLQRIGLLQPLKWPALTTLHSAAAVCVTTAFLYIGYKVNEAKVVYVVYSREDWQRDGGCAADLGLSFTQFYQFLVEVQLLKHARALVHSSNLIMRSNFMRDWLACRMTRFAGHT